MKLFFTAALFLFVLVVQAQKTENLVIVTLDGMRWQEVFKGVDKAIMEDSLFNRDPEGMRKRFWAASEKERREKLFPFLWSEVALKGQLYGNRTLGNKVDNANPYWFSYPGYNELFTGYPDTAVNSNDKRWNKNENILGLISRRQDFTGKVAAFATWDVFPYILNEPGSGVYVNADVDTLPFQTPALKLLNEMQFLAPQPVGVRPDVITYFMAKEYLKTYSPRVLYIAFDETDDFAHAGLYDQYIKSAHAEDAMIGDLWKWIQSTPVYKNKTTLLITTDHGRGDAIKANWKHHGSNIEDAHEIWFAVVGPDTKGEGEMKTTVQLYQAQLAATMGRLLGFDFKTDHPVYPPVMSVFK